MPTFFRSITKNEAEKIIDFINDRFAKDQHHYFATVIDARGIEVAQSFPANRTWKHIDAKCVSNFSISALYQFFKSKKPYILDDNLTFFIPIIEKTEMIGGIGFHAKDNGFKQKALYTITEYVNDGKLY